MAEITAAAVKELREKSGADFGAAEEPPVEAAIAEPEAPAASTEPETAAEGERQIDA